MKPRYPTLREAIYGALVMRSAPMGPSEAADVATSAAEAHAAGSLDVCACGWHVALCQHRQPWARA